MVVSRQTVAHARIKRPSTRGPGPPRWPPPPLRPIRRAETSPGEGRRAGRACRGGMAGREAVRRRHSLQAMRSRSSDSVPVPRPRGANCGCPWLPGSARVSTTAHARAPKIPSTSLSVVPFLAGLLPTAAPGTTADGTAGNVFLSVSPRAIAPHRSTSPSPDSTPGSPPLAPPFHPSQASQQAAAGGPYRRDAMQWSSWISTQWSPSPADGGTGGMFGERCAGSWPCPVAMGEHGAWSREAWSHAGRRLGPGARWRERLPWTILPKR